MFPPKTGSHRKPNTTALLFDDCDVFLHELKADAKGRESWPLYWTLSGGFVFVLDSSDLGHLEEAKIALRGLLRDEEVAGKPVLL